MGEAALQLVQTEPVEEKALTIVDQAKAVKVIDAESYTKAGELWGQIGDMIKEVKSTFDPICDATNRAHKAATEKRAKYLDPLQLVYKSVKSLMADWDAEQTRLRKIEEERLAAIQKAKEEKERQDEIDRLKAEAKAEEDRLMEAALAAERSGDAGQAEALTAAAVTVTETVKQEAAEILAAPVNTPPVILPKTTPKLQGGPVYTTRWSASVTDVKALCLAIGTGRASTEFVIGLDRDKEGVITSPSLNKQATSLKDTMCIPGVKAISKRV
jgi:primosomal protein N'